MTKFLSVAALAFFGLGGVAQAVTIDIDLGPTANDLTYTSGGTLQPDVNLDSSGLVLNHNAFIVSPPTTIVDIYVQPTGPLFDNNYLAVLGIPDTGMATYTQLINQHVIGFTWGTIDTYNTLVLKDSRNVSYTITGANILSHLVNPVPGTTQADVIFTDELFAIKTAIFTSSGNSFEVANLQDPTNLTTPLPATLPFFASALLALFFIGRRNGIGQAV